MKQMQAASGEATMDGNEALGTLHKQAGGALDLRFERRYPRAIEKVWSALTEPQRLAEWMGPARVEPRVGGLIELILDSEQPMSGRVLTWQAPTLLEFTWSNGDAPESTVRYELSRDGDGTKLVFIHKGVPYASSARMLPGWHVLFARLGTRLDGGKSQVPPSWRAMQTTYVAAYQLTGVALDVPARHS
jgi:uncharacterized protein YndB with AHSA1/START domain